MASYKLPNGAVITWHGEMSEPGHATLDGEDTYGFMEQLQMEQKLQSLTLDSDPPAMVVRMPVDRFDFVEVMHAHAKVVGVKLELIQ